MSQEPKELDQDKPTFSSPKIATKKEVDLFPPLAGKQISPSTVRGLEGSRLDTQVSLFTPISFDEALDIVECLRKRAAITICLEKMRKIDAGRLVDFVAGASAALDGDFHKLTEQVYVFCPSNIKLVPPVVTDSASRLRGPLDYLFSEKSEKLGFSTLWAQT